MKQTECHPEIQNINNKQNISRSSKLLKPSVHNLAHVLCNISKHQSHFDFE